MTISPAAFSKRLAAIALAASLSACSGTTSVGPPFPANHARSFAAAATTSESSIETAQRKGHKGRLSIRIRIPKERRHRRASHYISAATKGMTMAFTGPTTMTQAVNLTRSDPRCTGTPLTCTIGVFVAPGSYTVTVDTYDKAPVSGGIPAGANLLSTARNAPFAMTAGNANTIGVTLDGVPASFVVSGLPSGTIGTALGSPQSFTVTAKDAAGDVITGTYENPVTLSNSDGSGATSIATSGIDSPPAGKLLSSNDVATLAYTGGSIASATATASAIGATSGNATFAPVPTLSSFSASSGVIGQSTSETLTGNFASGATTVQVSGGGVTVRNVIATATSITATFFIDPEAAVTARSVSVQTGGGATGTTAQTFSIGNAGVVLVTLGTDTTLGATPGICPAGASGDLRYAICHASAGDAIVFDTTAIAQNDANLCNGSPLTCTVTLGAPLPPIEQNQTIDGGYFGRVNIDGASAYRVFFVDLGTTTLQNLQIQNALATGGAGSAGGYGSGGGGAGLGAGLFINLNAAANATNTYFLNCSVAGGSGGGDGLSSPNLFGGGGGLGGAGGDAGGGGGVLGSGSGANGGFGGGGGAATTGAPGVGGTGGAAYGANPDNGPLAGEPGNANSGGLGGFGGGSGGGVGGATGGFGGGGGTNSWGGPFGGGGGNAGAGGGMGGFGGGNGDSVGNGGGGGAYGPAIFVAGGGLTTINSGASNSTATGGAPGTSRGSSSATAGGADATPVFSYGGTINGAVGLNGPIAGALSGSAPALRRGRGSRFHAKQAPR